MRKLWKKLAVCSTCCLFGAGVFAFMPGAPGQLEAKAQIETGINRYGWQQEPDGWRYRNSDGSYAKGCFGAVADTWYYFDAEGYMVTGWQQVGDDWYYFEKDGHMVTGPVYIGETYYYFESSGKLHESFFEKE
ncbi:hypothetical protein [Lacrimispora sp. JR3]|uniref:hypothetical protein n=1 Tax=Lacrimispora sinapis TaxID=3111456 RepID=UPI00374882E5